MICPNNLFVMFIQRLHYVTVHSKDGINWKCSSPPPRFTGFWGLLHAALCLARYLPIDISQGTFEGGRPRLKRWSHSSARLDTDPEHLEDQPELGVCGMSKLFSATWPREFRLVFCNVQKKVHVSYFRNHDWNMSFLATLTTFRLTKGINDAKFTI